MKSSKIALGLLFLIFARQLCAKETWFHATGIDKFSTSQNFENFYNESNSFIKACSAKPDRICKRYINPDIKMAASPDQSKIVGNNLGNPFPSQGENILDEIRTAINSAEKGDRVVISLDNHGAPGTDRNGELSPSCVYFNEQKVCESDLKQIIGDAPKTKGFQVAVVASACYSGGFTALSNENVCVVTTADQQATGSPTNIWTTVELNKPNNLSELIANTTNNHILLASEYMEREKCTLLRKHLGQMVAIPENPRDESVRCNLNQFTTLNNQMAVIRSFVYNLPSPSNLNALCKKSTELCNDLRAISADTKLLQQSREFLRVESQYNALASLLDTEITKLFHGLTPREIKLIEDNLYSDGGLNPDRNISEAAFEVLNPQRRTLVLNKLNIFYQRRQAIVNQAVPTYERLQSILQKWEKNFTPRVRKLKVCLGSNAAGPSSRDETARQISRFKYTNEDQIKAKKCEQSFSF